MEMLPATRDNASGLIAKEDSSHLFMEMVPATRDNASGLIAKEDNSRMYQLERPRESADFGKTGDYNRKAEIAQNFRPGQ